MALGLIQLDEGALAQLAGQPVTLLHQKRERRIGGVVVPLTGGDDAGKAGRKPPPLALHLDLDGTVEGDHQLGMVVAVAADVALVATQAERGG